MAKNRNLGRKIGYTRGAAPCDTRSEKPQINDIRIERNEPHNYNTRSSTKRVKHVTTFKTAPNMFKMDAAEK